MTNQHDALKLSDAIENTTLNIFEDVRDMTDPDDGFGIIAHIEVAERNLAALKVMLRSPDFHVNHTATAPETAEELEPIVAAEQIDGFSPFGRSLVEAWFGDEA